MEYCDGCAAMTHQSPTFHARLCARSQPKAPPCGLIVFLHIERTGGTWIRNRLRSCEGGVCSNETCNFPAHAGAWRMADQCDQQRILREHWQGVTGLSGPKHECRTRHRLPPLNASRFVIEIHSQNWHLWDLLAPSQAHVRALYEAAQCTFTLFTILREPRAQALSYWRRFGRRPHNDRSLHVILGRQSSAPVPARRTNQTNLQQPPPTERGKCAVQEAISRLASMDVVGLYEHMDTALAAVSSRSGFQSLPPFAPNACRQLAGQPRPPTESLPSRTRPAATLHGRAAMLPTGASKVAATATLCDDRLYNWALARHAAAAASHASRRSTGRETPAPPAQAALRQLCSGLRRV